MKSGVPYDQAMTMNWKMALAHLVAAGEIDGMHWNWNEWKWEKP